MAAALLSEICRNQRLLFVDGVGHFERKSLVDWDVDKSWNLMEKIAKSRFVPPFWGLRGNVHGSSMARWKARGRLPISANWNFFASSYTVDALWVDIGRNCAVWKGVGHFERKFQEEGGRPPTNFSVKTRLAGLSRRCLRDPTFTPVHTIPACDTQTDRRTHDDGYYPRIARTARVKIALAHHSDARCVYCQTV